MNQIELWTSEQEANEVVTWPLLPAQWAVDRRDQLKISLKTCCL